MFNITNIILVVSALIIGYLIGSINSSIIICKIMTGKDIRDFGSGNAGATNALRTLGKKAGFLVFLFDALKAAVAILICRIIFKDNSELATYSSGIGAVLGHNYPVWFGFKGGKGIVVSLVSMLFADYKIGLVVFVISILIMAISKYVSLGSVLGSILFVILALIFHLDNTAYIIFVIILASLAIFRHKGNIIRLIHGTENKLSFSKKNQVN